MRNVKSLLFNHSAIFDMLRSDKPYEHSLALGNKKKIEKEKSKTEEKKSLRDFEDDVHMHLKYPPSGFFSSCRVIVGCQRCWLVRAVRCSVLRSGVCGTEVLVEQHSTMSVHGPGHSITASTKIWSLGPVVWSGIPNTTFFFHYALEGRIAGDISASLYSAQKSPKCLVYVTPSLCGEQKLMSNVLLVGLPAEFLYPHPFSCIPKVLK